MSARAPVHRAGRLKTLRGLFRVTASCPDDRPQGVESSRLPLGMNWSKAALVAAPDLKWESRRTSRDDQRPPVATMWHQSRSTWRPAGRLAAGSVRRDLMRRHQLERLDQRRVIEIGHAVAPRTPASAAPRSRSAAATRRARARPAAPGPGPSGAAGCESPASKVRLIIRSPCTSRMRLDGEAAHQRLAHLGRIGAGLAREQQRLADRGDVERDDDLVGDLGGLAVAVAADQRDVLAHLLEQRPDRLEHRRVAAAHDGQRRRLGADLAARHRRVDVVGAERVDLLARTPWSRSARSSSCRRPPCARRRRLQRRRPRRSRRTAPTRRRACRAPSMKTTSAWRATSAAVGAGGAPASRRCCRAACRAC